MPTTDDEVELLHRMGWSVTLFPSGRLRVHRGVGDWAEKYDRRVPIDQPWEVALRKVREWLLTREEA